MPTCEVLVKVDGATPQVPLTSAWIYILDGGTTAIYRTNPDGKLRKMAADAAPADATRPWKYETKALLAVPKTVRIYWSRGARPIPQTVLGEIFGNDHAYAERPIAIPPAPPASAVASTDATVIAITVAEVVVPALSAALTQPAELSLCPVLWDQEPNDTSDDSKDYLRAGINQGALTPTEGLPPLSPPQAVVAHERGVRLKGTIDAAAGHVRIRVLDASGAVLQLRSSAAGAGGEHLRVATAAATAGTPTPTRGFQADIWFDRPTRAFGLVHIIIQSDDVGEVRHHVGSFTVLLVGLQLAMVDDSMTSLDGSAAGPACNEAQEIVVLDFKKSPCREVVSSNLFVKAKNVKRKQADEAVSNKTEKITQLKNAFAKLERPRKEAAAALAKAVAQTTAAQAKTKLTETSTKLTALATAVTNAALSAKVTAALVSTPARDATGDASFDAAMQALATALNAVNNALDPPTTTVITELDLALTTAQLQLAEAITQVNIEVQASATAAQKAAAHAARTTATTNVTTHLSTFETKRIRGLTIANNAHTELTTGAAKKALESATTALATLLQDAKTKANHALAGQRRARRMVLYEIRGDQKRKYGGTGPEVPHPQMPMFMAELQVLGAAKTSIEELLVRRKRLEHPNTATPHPLRLSIEWSLGFKWKGPDVDPPEEPIPTGFADHAPGGYKLDEKFGGIWTASQRQAVAQGVVLSLGDDDRIAVTGDVATGAFVPVPVKLPFPRDTRRVPVVAVLNRTRPWGRASSAESAVAMVVEWQVPVVNASNREVLRGGDGTLSVATLTIDGRRVERGVSATVASATADLQLVPFRVAGKNITSNLLNTSDPLAQTVEQVIEQSYKALSLDHVAKNIDLAGWNLYRRMLKHESGGKQFNGSTSTDFRDWEARGGSNIVWSYGQEKGMPLHGHPHGFSMAQCDPHPSDDAMWSYIEAIRAGVGVLFNKANVAKMDLEKVATQANNAYQTAVAAGATGLQNPAASLNLSLPKHKEALLRAAVKRYNGGTEFVWGHPYGYVAPLGAAPAEMGWVIRQSTNNHDANNYPNLALGTSVNYDAPKPIAFTAFVLPAAPATAPVAAEGSAPATGGSGVGGGEVGGSGIGGPPPQTP